MARVFVSYASADLALAEELHGWLESAGHEVFLDRDPRSGIAIGDEWVRRLHERLRWAHALLCVITKDYRGSAWCTAELNTARLLGTRILPLRSGTVVHPLLDDVQHTDLTDRAAARARVARALAEIDAAGDPHWPDGRSPFPGLVPLDVDRHRVYFGREREIADLVELVVEGRGGTLVVGSSGCGKSSLVRAGLVPALAGVPGVFPLPVVVPGAHPSNALDHVLDRDPPQRPLLVIDQLEEVFTQSDALGRSALARRLRAADVHLVCTIRPEYLTDLLSDPHLGDLCTRVYPVTPLRREALRQVIERPAAVAGITIDEQLVARMIDDTGDGTALPLLAFTLARLSDGVGRGGKLSSARYDALGGVRGALLEEADAALRASGRPERDVLAALLSLVTVDERGQPTRRHVHRGSFPELAEFVARRLLTTDTIAGETVIGVAHEAFLTEWPPLAGAITEHAAALRTRRAVEHAAADWRTSGQAPSRLWQGAHLHSARDDVTRVQLSATAEDFLHASVRHDWRLRRRTVTVLSFLLVLAVVAAAVAYNRQLIAQDRQAEAEQRQRVAVVEQLIAQSRTFATVAPGFTLAFGVAAARIDPGNATANAAISEALAGSGILGGLPGQSHVVRARHAKVLASAGTDGAVTLWSASDLPRPKHRLAVPGWDLRRAVFSPDGRMVVTSDSGGRALFWKLTRTTPHRVGPVVGWYSSPITAMAFADDSRTLAIATRSEVWLWDTSDPGQPFVVGWSFSPGGGQSAITAVGFAPGGELLAVGGDLFDVSEPARPRLAGRLPVEVRDAAFSPVRGLAAVVTDGGASLVDVSDPANPRIVSVLPLRSEFMKDLDFSPDGHLLATAGGPGGTTLWDVRDPLAPRRVDDVVPAVTAESVSFSPDGRSLVVDDSIWDLTGRFRPQPIGAPFGGGAHSVAFSPDGTMLAIGGEDRAALWRLSGTPALLGEPLTRISPQRPAAVAFAPDGRTLAAGETLQDISDPGHPRQSHQLKPSTALTRFSPDGNRYVTTTIGATGNTPSVWDAHDPARHVMELAGQGTQVQAVEFTRDGSMIATVAADGTVRVWDAANPERAPDPLVGNVSGATTVTFSADNRVLVAGGTSGPALVWDTNGDQGGPRVGQPLSGGAVAQAAFAPRGRLLATSSPDGTVVLWDLTDSSTPRRLGPSLPARARGPLAFSPEGTALATSDVEDGVRLWNLRPLTSMLDKPLEVACGILGQGLSEQDWARWVPGLPYRETCP
ncbi:nSTAND1 domain-containing NTPase [Lentzea aerocolonigenes]|uniref:nSTAND1 domain-containing NTPase n=1 Tax=Lentzea aerocolonigenes TaxID=68170 RepID=UPI000B2D97E4|nr:TIR domain-containing protein [Lentzea aerocolonigenes]MCP2244508.1 WD40 repeat [Lentzea aerocolonigenes]